MKECFDIFVVLQNYNDMITKIFSKGVQSGGSPASPSLGFCSGDRLLFFSTYNERQVK